MPSIRFHRVAFPALPTLWICRDAQSAPRLPRYFEISYSSGCYTSDAYFPHLPILLLLDVACQPCASLLGPEVLDLPHSARLVCSKACHFGASVLLESSRGEQSQRAVLCLAILIYLRVQGPSMSVKCLKNNPFRCTYTIAWHLTIMMRMRAEKALRSGDLGRPRMHWTASLAPGVLVSEVPCPRYPYDEVQRGSIGEN